MKTKAAIAWENNKPWSIEEVDLDDPREDEVLVRLAASGLCHSDDHIITGDMPVPLPVIGGHEGSGVVEAVGDRVTSVKPGDHVVFSFLPACGRCRWCSTGRQNLCDFGALIMAGTRPDGSHRVHVGDQGIPTMSGIGTFSLHSVAHETSVVKIDEDIPLELAALVGCGVTTGWGSAVNTAKVRPGETVVVVGIGGIGMSAVQGARLAGAERIIAVDPVAFKREQAEAFGATHTAASMEEAIPLVNELTMGVMADAAILTAGVVKGDMIAPLMSLVSKGGRTVVTGVSPMMDTQVTMSLFELTIWQKEVRGSLYGASNPRADIPRLLDLYRRGQLRLDEMVTTRYSLEGINDGYAAMHAGTNIRGLMVYPV